jgi:biopolymer transport protein ExbB/biopolymer transport protein TolQ
MGSTWVLYLLIALSVLSLGIMLERWIFFRKHAGNPDAFADRLLEHLRSGELDEAREHSQKSTLFEAAVVHRALDWFESGAESLSEALDAAMGRKRQELERGLTFLGTLGNNAPFVGLFGTVIGVIEAFHQLGQSGGQQNSGAMGNVMVAISEALIATGVGLLVALPAVVGFNLAQKRVNEIESNVTTIGKQILAFLKAERPGRARLGLALAAQATEAELENGSAHVRAQATPAS